MWSRRAEVTLVAAQPIRVMPVVVMVVGMMTPGRTPVRWVDSLWQIGNPRLPVRINPSQL